MEISDEAHQRTTIGVKRAKVHVPHVVGPHPPRGRTRAPAPHPSAFLLAGPDPRIPGVGSHRDPRTAGRQLVVERLGASRCGRLRAGGPTAFTTRS